MSHHQLRDLEGTSTALITPFSDDGSEINETELRQLIRHQIDQGISGLVPAGTTGESPTLSYEEHLRVIQITADEAKGDVPVIAGCGSNCTAEAVKLTKDASALNLDAILTVTPYYNRPNQRGLYAHFSAIAQATDKHVILYDIPGRTGTKIETETVLQLAKDHPNIVGNKVATGNIEDIKAQHQARQQGALPEHFLLLSGDDSLTLDFLQAGANGVISVASNAYPAQVSAMVSSYHRGEVTEADQLNQQLQQLFIDMLSVDTNPIPIKALMHQLGYCNGKLRLPLLPLEADQQQQLSDSVNNLFPNQ